MEITKLKQESKFDPTGRYLLTDITYDIDGRKLYVKIQKEHQHVQRTYATTYGTATIINPDDFTEEEIIEAITPFWGDAKKIRNDYYRLTYYPTD